MNEVLNKGLISGHEGLELTAYRDTRGFLTVGRGFNLDAAGAAAICARVGVSYAAVRAGVAISVAQADAIFTLQYDVVLQQALGLFPDLAGYPDNAAAVILDMLFQLGLSRFLKFHDTLAAFKARNWAGAIAGIRNSALALQVPNRVNNNLSLLRVLMLFGHAQHTGESSQ